jgi:hypothetical protein
VRQVEPELPARGLIVGNNVVSELYEDAVLCRTAVFTVNASPVVQVGFGLHPVSALSVQDTRATFLCGAMP